MGQTYLIPSNLVEVVSISDEDVAAVGLFIENQVLADIEADAVARGDSEDQIADLLRVYAQVLRDGRERNLKYLRATMERQLGELLGQVAH